MNPPALPWFVRMLSQQPAKEVLQTERLLLRPLRYRDAQDFHAYATDAQVARFVLWEAHTSLRQTRAILHSQIVQSRLEGLHTKAIVLRDNQRMAGTIGLVWSDPQHQCAEVGFSLARACWGQGLMTEALQAYLSFMFTQLGYHRIQAQYDIRNPASGRVMAKAGMAEEGLLQESIYYKGSYANVVLCAALRDPWLKRAVQAENL